MHPLSVADYRICGFYSWKRFVFARCCTWLVIHLDVELLHLLEIWTSHVWLIKQWRSYGCKCGSDQIVQLFPFAMDNWNNITVYKSMEHQKSLCSSKLSETMLTRMFLEFRILPNATHSWKLLIDGVKQKTIPTKMATTYISTMRTTICFECSDRLLKSV